MHDTCRDDREDARSLQLFGQDIDCRWRNQGRGGDERGFLQDLDQLAKEAPGRQTDPNPDEDHDHEFERRGGR